MAAVARAPWQTRRPPPTLDRDHQRSEDDREGQPGVPPRWPRRRTNPGNTARSSVGPCVSVVMVWGSVGPRLPRLTDRLIIRPKPLNQDGRVERHARIPKPRPDVPKPCSRRRHGVLGQLRGCSQPLADSQQSPTR